MVQSVESSRGQRCSEPQSTGNSCSNKPEALSARRESDDGHQGTYETRVLYDRSQYDRLSLRNSERLGIGGPALTANSRPEDLLRDPRVRAMLDTIAFAEGTRGNGDYNRVVNGRVIGPYDRSQPYDAGLVGQRNVQVTDLRNHPNLLVQVNSNLRSTAAGRYQFLSGTWRGLNMPDFSARSQDLAAIKLMQRRGMIEPLLRGDFAEAIHRGAPEWASLPTASGGSYYGQGAKTLSSLRSVYNSALRTHQGTEPLPETPTPPSGNGNLTRGQRGSAVETLQDNLIRLGLMTSAQKQTGPGIFGPQTESSVKDFQGRVGLPQTGRFDGTTRSAMSSILGGDIKKGSNGSTVRALQDDLVRLGYMTRAQANTGPGTFGPQTDAALRRFQAAQGLTDDGIFGPDTFRAIRNARPSDPGNGNGNGTGTVNEYRRWNVYSTGHRPARLADGYEDLQPHHDYTSVNYVMRGLTLPHRLEARDIVLTRSGESNFGQALPSPLSGRVLFAGNENDGYGNKVVIRNDQTGQITMVGHMQSVIVRSGQTVSYGQNLGSQGSTGNSTGAHIHINADASVIRQWVADLADGRFDGVRGRFDVGVRP
jgi:muramidase (phage lysozyme)/peptidoglycan hydrolase-like protein with peptidoglycan-binding domain